MKKLWLLSLLLCLAPAVQAREQWYGWCQQKNSSTRVLGCTVTVYLAGTNFLAVVYTDNAGTLGSNPFTLNSNNGTISFYADNGRYDVRLSGGNPSISPVYTIADQLLFDFSTSSQPALFAGDILPANDSSGNVGNATNRWAAGRIMALTTDTSISDLGTLSVIGNTTLTGTLNAGTSATIGGNLSVSGSSSVTGTFTANGPSIFSGPVTFSGGLGIGNTNLASLATVTRTWTFPDATDTSVGLTATQTLSNKSFSDNVTIGTNPAVTGIIRIPNNQAISSRNAAGNADIPLIFGDPTLTNAVDIGAPSGLVNIGGASANGALAAGSLTLSGRITSYNGLSLTGNGVLIDSARIDLVTQTGSNSTTTFFTTLPAGAGLYEGCYYLGTTTTGSAGTVTVTLGWTGDTNAQTFTSPTVSLTSKAFNSGCEVMFIDNATNVTFATTVAGATGSPQYALHIRMIAF